VLSGKGGVGKSTVAVNLAVALALQAKRVGLLDADLHGPSVPKLLNLEHVRIGSDGQGIRPVNYSPNLKVMSIGFLLRQQDDAVIWRGPLKMNVLRQFLADVDWGELDFLVIDLPPGTGDEPLSICQLIPAATGAIVVTTPQEVALADVRKCINFCRQLNLPVIGVIENMSGFVCPHCGERVDIFKSGGGKLMAEHMDVPFLGRIPIDANIVEASDSGTPYVQVYVKAEAATVFSNVVQTILRAERSVRPPGRVEPGECSRGLNH
jgi:Mrp family chromosome partitioning ATPase